MALCAFQLAQACRFSNFPKMTANWPPPIDTGKTATVSHSKERIAYLHKNEVGTYHYGFEMINKGTVIQ